MKCSFCGETITIKRNKLVPMWDIECACTTTTHPHLEYGLERHQHMAGHPDEPIQCRAKLKDGTPVELPEGVEPPECGYLLNGD